MIENREGQMAEALDDKKRNEPSNKIRLNPETREWKRFKPSKIVRHLDRSNCEYFVINGGRILLPKDIHLIINRYLNKNKFKVSRIIKKRFNFIRLQLSLSIDKETKEKVLTSLKIALGVRIKRLKMRYNPDLKENILKKSEDISILTLNINDLRHKIEELNVHLQKQRPSIICLQETHRQDNGSKIFIPGYAIEEVPARDTGLGLLIGVRKDTDLIPKIISKTENMIILSARNTTTNLIVVNIYRHNCGPNRKKTMADIVNILTKYEKKNQDIILVGDWNSTPEEVMRHLEKAKTQIFADHVPKRGTRIKRSRRNTSRVIDFALSNKDGLIKSQARRRCWNISDHVPILIRINKNIKTSSDQKRLLFDRDLLSNKRIIKAILRNEHTISQEMTAEEAVYEFNKSWQQKLRDMKIIRLESVKTDQIMITKKIKKLIRKKRIKDKLVRRGILPLSEFISVKIAVKKAIRELRRKRYLNFIKKGINFLKNNDPRNSWRWIKKHCKIGRNSAACNSVIDPITKDLISDQKQRLEIWASHFKNLCKKDPNERVLTCDQSTDDRYQMITDCPISWDEIINESKCTRNNKASGIDLIPSEFYRIILNDLDGRSQFSKNILLLMNKVLNEGTCPNDWEECVIVPIYKKGDLHDPSNYRGIALINTLQKLFAKVMARRLQILNEEFNILKREQAGFIRSEECTGQATCLLECLQRRRFKGKDTLVCFLDLKKAYDLVPHKRLIAKLKAKGLGPKFIKVIEHMYSNTRMRVRIGNDVSEPFRYERGVRQGCPTSPLLFNFYIGDLIDKIKPVEVEGLTEGLKGLLFADDTVILADSVKDLEEKLKIIEEWMDENSMEINPSKCGVMQIAATDQVSPVEIKYKGEQIPNVDTYVYLGVEFNKELSLQSMSGFRVQKGISKMLALSPTLRNNKIPLEYKRMLIGNIIIPTVSYGSEIFGMSERRCSSLRKIADQSIGLVLSSKNFCRNRAYEEFDLKPIQVRAAISRTRGYEKWSESNGFIKDLILTSESFKSKKHTWSKTTRMWLKRFRIDTAGSTSLGSKEVLNDYIYRIKRKDITVASREANNYKIGSGKLIRRVELNTSCSSAGLYQLTRLRTGTYQFTNKLIFKQRIGIEYLNKCIFCKKNTIENTKHLIIECDAWKSERKEYLGIEYVDTDNHSVRSSTNSILRYVLGGNSPASGRKPADWIAASGRFLSAISRKRTAIIAALNLDNI